MKQQQSLATFRELLLKKQTETLSDPENTMLEEGLLLYPALKEMAESLERQKTVLAHQEYRFKPFFSGRVINKLHQKVETVQFNLMYAFKRIAVPAFAMLCVWLINIYLAEGSLAIESLAGLDNWEAADEYTYGLLSNL